MNRILKALLAGLAVLGLAAGASSAFAQKEATPKTDAKTTTAPVAKTPAAKPAEAPKAAAPMDINSASEKELASLKGIGEARSKAIVKGRPYKGKDELVQKKIIPQSVYDEIKDQIIAKQDTAAAKPAAAAAPAAAKPAAAPAPAPADTKKKQ